MRGHTRPHRHYCECGNYRTCSRPDCQVVGWECDDCEDERRTFYLLAREYERERQADPDTAQQLPLEVF
jgi:hypothetical protein